MRKKRIVIFFLLFLSCKKGAGPEPDVTFLAMGDIMLGRHIAKVMKKNGPDFPFQAIAPTLRAGDIVFGNLEAVIASDKDKLAYPDKPYSFHAAANAAPALQRAGFTILTLANNHAMDYGAAPLARTRRLLGEQGIVTFGSGTNISEARSPAIVTKKGLRFGFLGYGTAHARSVYATGKKAGIAPIRPDDIQQDIKTLRKQVDVLIVSLHWGIEYERRPLKQQRVLAHRIIDWGADMIIGHHPHVTQGVELYKGRIIAYSLGNFIFDQKGRGTDRSFVLACRFRGKAPYSAEIIPLDRFKTYFPKIAEGESKMRILRNIRALSSPTNTYSPELSTIGLK
jgi:poly-gamma-glutamate capsule biosynthesis protein CapA/YwtB (metallophosphatase superfamily)